MKIPLLVVLGIAAVQPLLAFTPEEIAGLRLRSPLPADGRFSDFDSRGSTVVGATQSGEIIISEDDGITWRANPPIIQSRDDLRPEVFGDVVASPESFIIFSQSRLYYRSTDLLTFSPLEFPGVTFTVSQAAYGDGTHLAVDFLSSSRRSSDNGLTWTAGTLPSEISSLRNLRYGQGRFVAVDSDTIASSPDGVTWTVHPTSLGAGQTFDGLSFANGNFFALGRAGLLYTSPDGTTWTKRIEDSDINLTGLVSAEADGSYVIYADFVGNFDLSADFSTISESSIDGGSFSDGVQTDSGAVIGGRLFGNLYRRAPGGSTIVDVREYLGEFFDSVAFGAGRFVVADSGSGFIFTSPDGKTFTFAFQVPAGENINTDVLFENGQFQFLSSNGKSYTSLNGLSWQENELGFFPRQTFEFLNGQFITFGFQGGNEKFFTSPDGLTWTALAPDNLPSSSPRAITYGEGLYVACGSFTTPEIFTSTDLVTWTPRSVTGASASSTFHSIGFGGGRFMAFGSFDVPALSEDGITWQVLSNGSRILSANDVNVYHPEIGFYVPGAGTFQYFPDDSTIDDALISTPFFPGSTRLTGIAEGNGVLVAVGSNALFSTSLSSAAYEGWAQLNFSNNTPEALRSPLADPDHDGQSNLQEYARGSDPESASPALTYTRAESSFGPEYSFTQRSGLTDINAVLEVSTDLENWSASGIIRLVSDLGNGEESITNRLTGNLGNVDSLYIRTRWSFVSP